MNIDMSSIMKKVASWSKTDEGKARMREAVEGLVAKGASRTAAGSRLVTRRDMENMAIRLANSIRASAQSCDLPASVMNNINSLSVTKPYQFEDGSWRVDLFFTDDLSRESLYVDEYRGVTNIIALFNNGYMASDNVYGWWYGHKSTGEFAEPDPANNAVRVRSLIGRPALQFMQKAVEDFNSTVGASMGATAVLAPIYEEIPTPSFTI